MTTNGYKKIRFLIKEQMENKRIIQQMFNKNFLKF